MRASLPERGTDWATLRNTMLELRRDDVDWHNGRASVYVFHPGDDVLSVAHDAYGMFISENGLGPAAFPSLKNMEADVTAMALSLQNAPDTAAASMTSGGTESILLAVKACRAWARREGKVDRTLEILIPASGHPAFDKAADLMDLRVVRIPVNDRFEADVPAMAAAVTDDTIMLVGSAPCFPYGVTDPIGQLSALALDSGLWLHVDACVGGYVAPFMRQIDPKVVPYDFSLPGVRSMSADLHKYGYAAKGASTILYRDSEDWRGQVFDFDGWPCGRMVTPTLAGTRPGGAIAAAWAVMHHLGNEGYVSLARDVLAARQQLESALEAMNLTVFGNPRLSLITFGSREVDVLAVGRLLYRRGWFSSRVTDPDGIHLMLSPVHRSTMGTYVETLRAAVQEVHTSGASGSRDDVRYT